MNRATTLISFALLLTCSGCSMLAGMLAGNNGRAGGRSSASTGSLDARVAAFETRRPDAGELGRGQIKDFQAALSEASDMDHTAQTTMDGAAADAVINRVQAARTRYVLAAASVARDANVSYWILLQEIARRFKYSDAPQAALNAARHHAQKRAELVQQRFAEYGSYKADGTGGNCIFSTSELASTGTRDPNLTHFVSGDTTVRVRCFATGALAGFARPNGRFELQLRATDELAWTVAVGTPSEFADGVAHVDAAIRVPQGPVAADDYAALSGRLYYWYVDGFEYDDRGARRPIWRKELLASSTLLWERVPAR